MAVCDNGYIQPEFNLNYVQEPTKLEILIEADDIGDGSAPTGIFFIAQRPNEMVQSAYTG